MEGRRHTLRACAVAIVGMLALQARSSLGQETPRSYVPNVQQGSMPVGGLPLTQPLPSSPGKIMTGEPVSVPLESQPGQVIASGPVTDLPAESATGYDHDHMHGDYVRDLVKQVWGYADPENAEVLSVHQLACLIDCLDKKLYCYGKIAVQAPTVFGQNRMTGYRQDYEDQMKAQLGTFELILSAYQRRADSAALTSATSIAAAVQPRTARAGGAAGASSSSSSTVAIPSPVLPFTSLFTNASQLIGQNAADLVPSAITSLALANSGNKQGIGLEPTVALDERSDFINHLNQLRRINAGDDASDLPGYGLYLIRMPVSLLPSQESIKGKGASVTVKAKHNLTPDVLPNTFRNVVILDTAYSLMDAVVRGQFCIPDTPSPCPSGPSVKPGGSAKAETVDGSQAVNSNQPAARAQAISPIVGGNTQGTSGNAPRTEVMVIIDKTNVQVLADALLDDQKVWYRHDPSTVSWLLAELSSTYDYMREQAHRNNPMFQPIVFEQIGSMVLQRRYGSLGTYRETWIKNLKASRGAPGERTKPIDVLAFALIVQSVFLDREIKYDMELLAQRKHCACGDAWNLTFYDLYPTTPEDIERYSRAQAAFSAYVECKWPIHIFALDPVVDQQNRARPVQPAYPASTRPGGCRGVGTGQLPECRELCPANGA